MACCHCRDCKRWTGSPLPAFAAFGTDHITCTPAPGPGKSHAPGVTRWNCPDCGSPLMATFRYLPGQVFVPLGLFDAAAELPPALHCHADGALPWLHLDDDLPRRAGSGRAILQGSAT